MPNKTPKANKVTVSGFEDQPVAIQLSGSDPDGSVSGYRLSQLPVNGTLYLDASRTLIANANVTYLSNTFYFVPVANYSGTASFTYSVVDNQGAISPATTATISVAAVNDAPLHQAAVNCTARRIPLACRFTA